MARYWTADLHFGHANIIRYCDRPFADVDQMNAGLIERWNETVSPDDEVWVLGDVAMGTIADSLPLVGRLHGRKVLVPGNHDRCWFAYGERGARWVDRYLEAGFDEIVQGVAAVTLGPHLLRVCHFPYEGDSHDEDRFTEHRPHDDGGWLLHGHVHERWQVEGRQINVGVDVWGYRPVADDELRALLPDPTNS